MAFITASRIRKNQVPVAFFVTLTGIRLDDVHYLETFTYDFDDSRSYQKFDYKLWVKFDIWHGISDEGKIYEQLVMRIIRSD